MPAFGKKLKSDEIQAVAQYVIGKAEVGWKK
jgi:mono/diheme cytochrome c family protein